MSKSIKSFSLDRQLLEEIERTRGSSSASERVSTLLRTGLEAERHRSLHSEAAEFFAVEKGSRSERLAFQKAAIKSVARD